MLRTPQAWFDEARANNAAHSYGVECAAMGICNHLVGECECREGWTGAACERLTCDGACSGHGACLPMYRLAQYRESNGESDAVAYGIDDIMRPFGTSVYAKPQTWDYDVMYGCLCDSGGREQSDSSWEAKTSHLSRAGPRAHVSGVYTHIDLLSGWAGYRCSERESPCIEHVHATSNIT